MEISQMRKKPHSHDHFFYYVFAASKLEAHVKWFVADEGTFASSHFNLDSLLVICGAALFLLLASWAEFSSHKGSSGCFIHPG